MNKFSKKLGIAIAICVKVGLVLSLTGSVSALRRIDNRVDIDAPAIPLGGLGVSSSSSGNHAFEKGDVIYREFHVPAVGKVAPGMLLLLSLWSRVGHCGLYWYWEPDEKSDPTIKENHKTIESNLARPHPWYNPLKGAGVHDNYDFQYFVDSGQCWGVRTSQRINAEARRRIIQVAIDELDSKYNFFGGYKRPGVSFRCDGLVEYCYEKALGEPWRPGDNGGIVENDFWRPRRGCRVLTPRRQFRHLIPQDEAYFWKLTFGKSYPGYEPVYIDGKYVPLEDGKYKVYGDEVEIKIYANDKDYDDDGSGIARIELWIGEPGDEIPDDMPKEMPGLRLERKDYPNGPMEDDYTYTWDTTKTKDGEPLFPNGDYTLKAIAFDQAGNKAEAELNVEVANAEKYLHVRIEPSFVQTDGSDNTQTAPFTIYVQVYNPGTGGTTPEGGVNKKEGTQSYKIVDGKPALETCYTDQVEEATKDNAFNGIVNISTMFSDIEGISLYKEGWDGTIELVNGSGNVSGVRYKTDDDSDLDNTGLMLVQGDYTELAIKGNDLLLVNPTSIGRVDEGGHEIYRKGEGWVVASSDCFYCMRNVAYTCTWGCLDVCRNPWGDPGSVWPACRDQSIGDFLCSYSHGTFDPQFWWEYGDEKYIEGRYYGYTTWDIPPSANRAFLCIKTINDGSRPPNPSPPWDKGRIYTWVSGVLKVTVDGVGVIAERSLTEFSQEVLINISQFVGQQVKIWFERTEFDRADFEQSYEESAFNLYNPPSNIKQVVNIWRIDNPKIYVTY